MATPKKPDLGMLRWLPVPVLVINLGALALARVYSLLNLQPFLPAHDPSQFEIQRFASNIIIGLVFPVLASIVYLWPLYRWIPEARQGAAPPERMEIPPLVVGRAANAPAMLGLFSFLTWVLSGQPLVLLSIIFVAALVEKYFSLFLSDIRARGGNINETAGDGLMILFQGGNLRTHALSAVWAARRMRGRFHLKNIQSPVEAFEVEEGEAETAPPSAPQKARSREK